MRLLPAMAMTAFAFAGLTAANSDAQARDYFSFSIGSFGPGGGFSLGYHDVGRRGRSHFHGHYNFLIPPAYYAPRPYYYPRPYTYYAPRPRYYAPAPAIDLDLFPPTAGWGFLSAQERAAFDTARGRALTAPIGDAITWNSGNARGTVMATRDGWAGERYCREYRQDVIINGRAQESYGTACQTADGAWQMVANQR